MGARFTSEMMSASQKRLHDSAEMLHNQSKVNMAPFQQKNKALQQQISFTFGFVFFCLQVKQHALFLIDL